MSSWSTGDTCVLCVRDRQGTGDVYGGGGGGEERCMCLYICMHHVVRLHETCSLYRGGFGSTLRLRSSNPCFK